MECRDKLPYLFVKFVFNLFMALSFAVLMTALIELLGAKISVTSVSELVKRDGEIFDIYTNQPKDPGVIVTIDD